MDISPVARLEMMLSVALGRLEAHNTRIETELLSLRDEVAALGARLGLESMPPPNVSAPISVAAFSAPAVPLNTPLLLVSWLVFKNLLLNLSNSQQM